MILIFIDNNLTIAVKLTDMTRLDAKSLILISIRNITPET